MSNNINYDAYFKLTYGLYIVSSKFHEKYNGHISNTVFQVSSDPALFAVCSNKDNLTASYILLSRVFSVSVLEQDVDMKFIGHFGFKSGATINKFDSTIYKIGITGAPIVIDKTIAYIECRVINLLDVGTHYLFIGEIADAGVFSDKVPLTYNYYREVIKGKAPKNAPTYIANK